MEEGKDDKDACLRSRVCENALRALAAIPTTSPPITANDQATDTADPSIEEEGNVPLLVPTPHFPSLCMTASERDALLLSAKSSKALRAILLLSEGGCE